MFKYSGTRQRTIHIRPKTLKVKGKLERHPAFEVFQKRSKFYRKPAKSERSTVIVAMTGPKWRRERKNKKTGEMERMRNRKKWSTMRTWSRWIEVVEGV